MKTRVLSILAIVNIFIGYSQLIDGNAYMIGDFVRVGISQYGIEGAPCVDGILCRTDPSDGYDSMLGFMANPQMDGWGNYDGDFVTTVIPENGFGLTYRPTYPGAPLYIEGHNNHVCKYCDEIMPSFDIVGEITEYYETPDSCVTIWRGGIDVLDITVIYRLKKDELFYTTDVYFDNTASLYPIDDFYFYRNLDPENNYALTLLEEHLNTNNIIVSQSGGIDDSVIVRSTQYIDWETNLYFKAYGENWRGFIGGAVNRNADQMWGGGPDLYQSEGASILDEDVCMGLVYYRESLITGKSTPLKISYVTSSTSWGTSANKKYTKSEFTISPNPVNGDILTINSSGNYVVNLYALDGTQIYTSEAFSKMNIDVSDLKNGIYFVCITRDGISNIQKLVKY